MESSTSLIARTLGMTCKDEKIGVLVLAMVVIAWGRVEGMDLSHRLRSFERAYARSELKTQDGQT
jgi:hypothetical protein